MKSSSTSWGTVARWYQDLLKKPEGTYQHDVILPHILRLLQPEKGLRVLDLACGPGYFARAFAEAGVNVTGIDIAPELIALAEQEKDSGLSLRFFTGSADRLTMISNTCLDAVTIILAIQNIENMAGVFAECARVLAPGGRVLLVLTHPAFRVPRASAWGWDEKEQAEYRRVDAYLSESRVKIEMHPGLDSSIQTWTFHRPLQAYMKALAKAGFAVTKLEEWISNREPPRGKVFAARNRARKEIPLFLFLEATKQGVDFISLHAV